MIYDSHTHIFPPEIIKKREYIAKKDEGFCLLYGDKRAKMVDKEGLLNYMEKEGIKGAVILSFPFRDKGLIKLSNDYLIESSRDFPLFPFVMIDLSDEKWSLEELERAFSFGAKGVGEIGNYGGKIGKREFERLNSITAFLKEKRAPLLLHINEQIGHRYPGKTEIDFQALYEFVMENPDLTIILAHLGGGVCFFEFMPEVKKAFKNLYYDLAACPFLYMDSIYSFVGKYIGEKTLFGSDFPLLSYSRYEQGLLGLRKRERERILFKNLERILL